MSKIKIVLNGVEVEGTFFPVHLPKISDTVSVEPTLEEFVTWVQVVIPIVDRLSYAGSIDLNLDRTITEMRQNFKKASMCLYSAIELTRRLDNEFFKTPI